MTAAKADIDSLIAKAQLMGALNRTTRRQAAIERRLATNLPRHVQRPSLHSNWLHPEAESEPWVAEKVHMVETVAAWLDSIGPLVGPNPQEANSIEEFVDQLRLLRAWAGDPTLRELEKRAETGRLPRSSISDMLRGTGRLPKLDLVVEFVKACGAGEALPAWIAAWHRLKRPRIAAGQQAA